MRLNLSFLTFALAILLGTSFTQFPTLVFERFEPAFTKQEAESMVGQYVRSTDQTEFIAMQCSEDGQSCSETKTGERGIIKKIDETTPNRYFVIVQWETPHNGKVMFSYCGRMTARTSLKFEKSQK